MRDLDIVAFRLTMPSWLPPIDDHGALMAMHKARYEHPDIERELRLESEQWLRIHGYHRIGGGPLLPPGELPNNG